MCKTLFTACCGCQQDFHQPLKLEECDPSPPHVTDVSVESDYTGQGFDLDFHWFPRIAVISYKEKRKWLLTWSSIYVVSSAALTLVTYSKGPDSHEWYGCSVPLSLWSLFLFLSTLSYYTTDYMHRGQQEGDRERYVYDPKVCPAYSPESPPAQPGIDTALVLAITCRLPTFFLPIGFKPNTLPETTSCQMICL